MKANIRHQVCFVVVSFLLLLFAPSLAHASEPPTLKVAFCELDGFFEYDAEGNPTGYGTELLGELSEYAGVHFTYVPADSWEQAYDMLLDGQADVRLPVTRSTTPSKVLDCTNESVLETSHALMTSKARDDLFYKDFEHFSSLKVAMSASLYRSIDMPTYLSDLGLTEDNIVQYEGYAKCKQALDSEEVDAVISNVMDLTNDLKILARFNSASSYLQLVANSPYLDTLDTALNELKMDNPAFLPSLYQKYYPESSAVPYTREEMAYIQQTGAIKVGQVTDRSPFFSVDSTTGKASGMFVDLCNLIAQKSGLTFSYEALPVGTRAADWLEQTDGDLVSGVMYSALTNPSPKLTYTDTAFLSSIAIVGRQNDFVDPEEAQTIAVPAGFIGGTDYIAATYPNATARIYDSNEACLDAIMLGDADLLLQDIYVARDALQNPRFKSLEILPVYQMPESMKLVMLDGKNDLLMSILNKAIGSITDEELNTIVVAHTVAEPYQITPDDILFKFREPLLIIALLIAALLVSLVSIIVIRQRNMKRLEAKNVQLADAYEQAQLASRAKSDFLARMSHEIRTPMNAIMGITELAKDHTTKSEKIQEDLDNITLSSKVLLSIINDVLDMSAIESGKLNINTATFDIQALIASLSAMYDSQCRAKGIAFKVTFLNDVDTLLIGDQLRLNQVLLNLLSNAVKFTDQGSVNLVIEQRIVQQTRLFVHFEVSDTGCGMSTAMLSRLWQPFEQESAHTAQEYGGSGLGLSIVKNLVTLMGGTITVESEKGVGTTFLVDLPFERSVPATNTTTLPSAADHQDDSLSGHRVLLAEDNTMNRIVAVGLLKKADIACDTAADGKAALDAFEASEPNYYDAILMDIHMPVMNGYEATKAIRALKRPDAQTVPILALTANAFSEDVAEALQSGIDDHLVKPIEYDMLTAALDRLFRRRGN